MAPPTRPSYDVVVVGARIAGATVAALLGDRGVSVLLVERVRFPRTTISTHFFRGAGLVSVLDRLSLLEPVLALGSPPLRREWSFGFGNPGPEVGPAQDPGEAGYCLSVRRAPLDELLLERARRCPGVEIAQPVSVRGLIKEDGRVVGVRLDDKGQEHDVRSRIVIGADGRHSLVARGVEAPSERAIEPLRTLYYRYVSGWLGPDGAAPDAAEFSLNGDEMAYVFPSDGGVACVGLSAHHDGFSAFRSDPDGELDRRLGAHPGLAPRLREAVAVGRAAGGPPEPNWMRTPCGPGWALVGDAGLHQDPWTGEGMDNAGTSAVSAAEAIGDWLTGQATEHEALERYRRLRDERLLASFEQCTSLGRDLTQLVGGAPEG
jgi:flavin-dependent dehydrogenase